MGASTAAPPPVVVVKGGDEVVVREYVTGIVERLVGDGDYDMMVDDVTLPDPAAAVDRSPEAELADAVGAVISSAQTPPFLTDRRVVVTRGCALMSRKEDVASLVAYLADPMPTTSLVLVWNLPPDSKAKRSATPKSLIEAVGACGGVVEEIDPGKKVADWVTQRLKSEPYTFDTDAVALLVRRVGEDPDTLIGFLMMIRGNFAEGARITAEDIEPLLADQGGVPPWAVTDAIEAGDPTLAVLAVQRMLGPGERHPLQILASLSTYVANMLALDGSGVSTRDQAHRVLGGAPYVAQKALTQGQRLGSERVADLVRLVAEADLDLRGRRRQPEELVMEVLVARMASRSGAAGRRGSRAGTGAVRR